MKVVPFKTKSHPPPSQWAAALQNSQQLQPPQMGNRARELRNANK